MMESGSKKDHRERLKNRLRILRNNVRDDLQAATYQISSLRTKISNLPVFKKRPESIILSQREIDKKKREIKDINTANINLFPFDENSPLVSIIVLNRNGLGHLKRLFDNFSNNIHYPNYEIIVVDNASIDDSISFLEDLKNTLPLEIIENKTNQSFSQANNSAVDVARGEFVLLLNNDVEPLYGWLNQMMQVALRSQEVGAVGAKLVYPYTSTSRYNQDNSFRIQHAGIAFRYEGNFIKPYNRGNGLEPFEDRVNREEPRAAVTAAALLVKKDTYLEVGGLDEGYHYGYEDVDFCLKLLKNGYKNLYCPQALLFHYEFGTQENDPNQDVKNRRISNRELFTRKWRNWLRKELRRDKINASGLFSDKPLQVALVVTECGADASAGDYFTALELGEALKELGWDVRFLPQQGPGYWYDVPDEVDVLISLLDTYDPRRIKCANPFLIKIGWPRNWFDRWVENPGFYTYNLIFTPSKIASRYIERRTGKRARLLPIATNLSRFNGEVSPREEFSCDYCFTGSYWKYQRDIITMLDPESLPFQFKLYGKNWEQFDKFKKYYQGFISYSDLPAVYASTKIVVDDANQATKEYGAVNSRVYDALATGTLVITNGKLGAEETFKGLLPVYNSKQELNHLIEYYLGNETERKAKTKELQLLVLGNHTYGNRAATLKKALEDYVLNPKISIKVPAPQWKTAHRWGDYHLALGLKKEFEKRDCEVLLQILPEWYQEQDVDCDVVIVLRGLSKYQPKKYHFNIMWNISHPDNVDIDEYNQYNHVFIASELWAQHIQKQAQVTVEPLLQCTDPELFYPEFSSKYQHELLFVGNSRKVFRKILKDLLPTDKDLAVYGTDWNWIIKRKYIKGKHIPNQELRRAYSSCKILLNDHWEDMREKGFLSNRLFDGFASGAFIISDPVQGAGEVFADALVTYQDPDDLHSLVDHYLEQDPERKRKAARGREIVLGQHTFEKRVERILEVVNR